MADPSRPSLWFRCLLRLQPRGLREQFGEEWLETARQRDRAMARRGWAVWVLHRMREAAGAVGAAAAGRRDSNSWEAGMMDVWRQDLRYAWRSLVRSPGFLAIAVLVLGAGIGATTTIFSGVHAVLLAPLPFDRPERLVGLWERNPDFGWEQADAAPANVLDWRERVDAFEDVAAYRGGSLGGMTWIDADGTPRRVATVEVTGNLFGVLGIRPHLGAFPDFDDTWAGASPWVVVSHAFWSESLGGDLDVIGRTVELDGIPAQVRAVLPEGMRFPIREAQLWRPYFWDPAARQQAWFRRAHFVTPVARLADGATLEQARAQLDAVALQLQDEYPELNANMFAGMTPLPERLVGDLGRPLRTLMAGVAVLLLLACLNVGNLFLVRAEARVGELTVRRAVGAPTRRLVGQLLTEALLVGVAGGVLGLLLSAAGIGALEALRPLGVAGVTSVGLNGPVLAFGAGVSLLAVLAFGLLPATKAARRAIPSGLSRAGGRSGGGPGGATRSAQGLIPLQTALAVVLVLAAGLVTRSFDRLRSEDPGIVADGVWAFSVALPAASYESRDAVLDFFDRALERIEAVPAVEGAAVTSGLPLTFSGWTSQLVARHWEPDRVVLDVRHRASTPGYFDVMGVPLLRGRRFEAGDGLGGDRVAIVNESFADTYFADEPVLGRQVTFDRVPTEASVWRTIVGVVGDERQATLSQPADPEVWEPFPQDWGRVRTIVVKHAGTSDGLRASLAAALTEVDPNVPLDDLRRMDDIVEAASADARFLAWLFSLFATLALALAAVGLYGVTAQVVRRRVPEFGIRMALGADHASVMRLVLSRTLVLAGAGVVAGTLVALSGAGVLESLLYETGARDPVAFAAAPAILLAVALAAAWWPAVRAAGVDPARSLSEG